AGVRREDRAHGVRPVRGGCASARADPRSHAGHRTCIGARRDTSSVGGAIRARAAGFVSAGRFSGRPVYRVWLVTAGEDGSRISRGSTAALAFLKAAYTA